MEYRISQTALLISPLPRVAEIHETTMPALKLVGVIVDSACDFLLAIYRVGTRFHARLRFLVLLAPPTTVGERSRVHLCVRMAGK